MPSPSKKERRRLVATEIARRQKARVEAAGLSRAQLDDLFTFVAERVWFDGHDGTFALTRRWLAESGANAEAVLTFLDSQRIADDWELLVLSDPCELFGPTASRLRRMPLARAELQSLIHHLEAALDREGCSHDHAHTEAWLRLHDLPIPTNIFALMALGGGCDCEVVMNVIYPPAE